MNYPGVYPFNQQPINGLISVNGIDGAKAYPLPAGSKVPLFDANEDIFYIKSTDSNGFPDIKMYSFTAIDPEPAGETVSKQAFDDLAALVSSLSVAIEELKAHGE